MNILNRSDESFVEFLKKYWWVETLIFFKVIVFLNKGYYGLTSGLLFILGGLFVLWILYRLGME